MNNLNLPKSNFLLLLLVGIHAQRSEYYSTANLSTTWNSTSPHATTYHDGAAKITITTILLRRTVPPLFGPAFAFGFYCRDDCEHYLLSIYIIYVTSWSRITNATNIPQVIWSANRNKTVKPNSILELSGDGDLLLKDSDGSLAWSTNTTGGAVVGLQLLESGNLVLFDADGDFVWQSFDHPSGSLLSGQSIVGGRRLTANASPSNFTRGDVYISYTSDGFRAFVGSNPPEAYYDFENKTIELHSRNYSCFITVTAKALTFEANSSSRSDQNVTLEKRPASVAPFLRLESDGHLRLYEWNVGNTIGGEWSFTKEAMKLAFGECAYPTACSRYSICSGGGQCSCPRESPSAEAFRLVDRDPKLGCEAKNPLSCESPRQHRLLEVKSVSYFNYRHQDNTHPNYRTVESCKKACLRNCSCRAAFFQYGSDASPRSCRLLKEVFTLINDVRKKRNYSSTAYIKVQEPRPSSPSNDGGVIAGVAGAMGAVLLLILGISIFVCWKRRAKEGEEEEEEVEVESFLQLNCMPTRFSYEDLRSATDNFASYRKLGSGGFGSVFEGRLEGGTKIAVKKLDSVCQGKKELLAEIQTIGSIHHLHLVRLIGFCVEKLHKLLVYEYMTNGSLDKWIFPKSDGCQLSWETRRNIICDVAKGLLYLHEGCRQKIAHLDIKPQNILLDSNFNAKVADFGMAKLIARDQSAVQTVMRGTPGYMAPEWLSALITEKVDVYSFGIVILEVVCTRKNLDYSQPEESVHLLPLLKEKATSGKLLDLLDERERNVQNNAVEMVKMLKLAIWCLHDDTCKRPSMSMVLKVLEGTSEMCEDLGNDAMAPAQRTQLELQVSAKSSRLLESVLSGPR